FYIITTREIFINVLINYFRRILYKLEILIA
ncbi:unnamed protein product, partial [marine sediment metagenome]